MESLFVRLVWIITTTAACSAQTTMSNITAAYNTTTVETHPSNDHLVDAYQKLRDMISNLLNNNYPVPPKFYSSFGSIRAAFEPLQIITLDEVLQSISISSAITLTWRDPSVRWNPGTFEGIEWIKLPSSYFWLPTIIIPETAVEDSMLTIPNSVDVSYQGIVTVLIPTITTTLCNLDLTYFPFDQQNCTLAMIESEFYNMTSFVVSLGDMNKYFGTNAAWKLIHHDCYHQTSVESNPPFSYVSCHVEISRRSAFYLINLIGPMAMTSLMTLIAFCVPAEGGEKVSFIVSMFMSTSVFYNYIINITPRSMENLPRVNILLVAIAVQIIFATAAIVFVLIRFNKTKRCRQNLESRHSQEQNSQEESGHQTKDQKKDNFENISSIPNQTTLAVGSCFSDGVKKRSGKSTEHETDANNERTRPQKKTSKPCRRLTCDELDMLFFCVMCVLTALLYLCIFFV